jgi:hypothetical protein
MYTLLAEVDLRDPTIFAPAKVGSVGTLMSFFIPFITLGAGLAFLAMLLFGAFQWITAGDNPENVSKSQKTIVFAIFGLILVIVSFAVMKIIGVIFGLGNALPF